MRLNPNVQGRSKIKMNEKETVEYRENRGVKWFVRLMADYKTCVSTETTAEYQ